MIGVEAAVYAPLQIGGRADAVSLRLADAIVLGVLPDGEKLPSEDELAEMLGVSAMTVREALSWLRERGMVETRRGRNGGSLVRAVGDPAERVGLRLAEIDPGDLRAFADYYALTAGATARLAAARADDGDLLAIRTIVEAMENARGAAGLTRLECRFHLAVALASGSARLAAEERTLQSDLGTLLWARCCLAGTVETSASVHRRILEALGERDGGAARELTEAHVLASLG